MYKGIEWLKSEVEKQDIVMDKGHIYTSDLIYLINQLDEPEVLSEEWLDENKSSWTKLKVDGYYIPVEKLQNLLVPKQEELESKIKVLIEAYKQEDGAYSNPENGWISGFVEDLKNLVEEEPSYYALIKGHELIAGEDACKYWKCDMRNGSMFLSNRYSHYGKYLAEMSKNDWGKFDINDTNADFVRVDD